MLQALFLYIKPDSTRSWKLRALPGGRTRLVARLRQYYRWQSPAMALFTLILLEFGDFPMLRGIKLRAEDMSAAA